MSEDRGWIKLYRKIDESSVWKYKNPMQLKLWIKCLISANHQETNFLYGKDEIVLNPGEFIYGRNEWAKDLDIRTSTLRNLTDNLVKWGQIKDLRKDKGIGSIYKVTNWDCYQEKGQDIDRKKDKVRTNLGQSKDTQKNVKNDKNEIINTSEVVLEKKNPPTNDKTDFFALLIDRYNFTNGTKKKKISPETEKNILYWLDYHSEEDIITAVENQPNCKVNFYREIEFDTIFRTLGRDKQPVDYVGAILKNYKKENNYES